MIAVLRFWVPKVSGQRGRRSSMIARILRLYMFQHQGLVTSEGNHSHSRTNSKILGNHMFFAAINCKLDLLPIQGSYFFFLTFEQVKFNPAA